MEFGSKSEGVGEGHFGTSSILTARGNEGLGGVSGSSTSVCPRDAPNLRAVPPLKSGMSEFVSSCSDSNFTTPTRVVSGHTGCPLYRP